MSGPFKIKQFVNFYQLVTNQFQMGNSPIPESKLPVVNFPFPVNVAHAPPNITHTKLIINTKQHTFQENYYLSSTLLIECIRPYVDLCNLVFEEGSMKDMQVSNKEYLLPLKQLHMFGVLKLKVTEKRLLISQGQGERRYISESIDEGENGLVFNSTYTVEGDHQRCRELQQDPDNFQHNIVSLLNTFQTEEVRRTIHQSYKRERAKKIQNPQDIDQTAYKGSKQLNASRILGQYYKSRGYQVHLAQESSPLSLLSMLKISGMLGEDYYEGEFDISQWQVKLEQLKTNQFKRLSFVYNTKEIIAKQLKTTEEKIHINEIRQDKILVSFPKSCDLSVVSNPQNLFDRFQFSESDFDLRGSRSYQLKDSSTRMRGGYPYFQPVGWKRYGLNVESYSKGDGSAGWLGNDQNIDQWAVMYHGVKNPTLRNNIGICTATAIAKHGLKIGNTHVHEQISPFLTKNLVQKLKNKGISLDQYMSEQIYRVIDVQNIQYDAKSYDNQLGEGIYGSPLLNQICVGQSYAGGFDLDGEECLLAFQCRVRPESIYISSEEKKYWLVRKPSDVRVYGILVCIKKHLSQDNVQKADREFQSAYSQFCRQQDIF